MKQTICSVCVVEDTDPPKEARARGLCPTHYQRANRLGAFGDGWRGDACPHCIVEGLDGDVRPIYTRGMCRRHYLRKRKSGEIDTVYAPRGSADLCTACLAAGEERPVRAKGLCGSHYGRAYRGADTSTPIRKAKPDECSFPGCDKPTNTGRTDLCAGHYMQKRRGKPLTPLRSYTKNGGKCGVESHDCPKDAVHDGLCNRHYQRRLEDDPEWDRPVKAKAENGAGHLSRDGYRFVTIDGRSVAEHRHVMERLLGRRLIPGESVHHLNGSRSDNRTDGPLRLVNGKLRSGNLELWSSSQPAGQEVGPKLDWAVELLEEYAEFLPVEHRARLAGLLGDAGEGVAAWCPPHRRSA